MDDGVRVVEGGACGAWLLPGNATCAGAARRVFRRVAAALGVDPGRVDDGEMMVSELAANTLHVQCGGAGSELWLYLRGAGAGRELVCKVFDGYPGWARGAAPGRGRRRAPVSAMSGRGLDVVRELSGGHWGYHLTRARLGGWHVRGKAVWFVTSAAVRAAGMSDILTGGPGVSAGMALPSDMPRGARGQGGWGAGSPPCQALQADDYQALAMPGGGAGHRHAGLSSRDAMARVQADLAARGFGDTMVRADDPATDTAVLSVCDALTVWCRAGVAWLRAPGADGQKWDYTGLVEVAEQAVEAHERLCTEPGLAEGKPARQRLTRGANQLRPTATSP